jgi:hypothetical protein
MPYGLILTVAAVALSARYLAERDAPYWIKAIVLGLVLFSFNWPYGIYLQAVIGTAVYLHLIYLRSR